MEPDRDTISSIDDWKASPALVPQADGNNLIVTGYGLGIGPPPTLNYHQEIENPSSSLLKTICRLCVPPVGKVQDGLIPNCSKMPAIPAPGVASSL